MSARYLIGVDEAGRGPLAGPVAVGAFAVKSRWTLRKFDGVKDSKQLSQKQREEWFELIRTCAKNEEIFYAVSFSRPETIDTRGLSHAIYSALNRCLKRLECLQEECRHARVLLDGSLYASERYPYQTTIIDGDAKEPIIALASICAKVLRDRRMVKMSRQFPEYGFEAHKGYGTKAHYVALRKHGISSVHRRSFLGSLRVR